MATLKLELNDERKEKIKKLFEEELTLIQSERDEYDLENKWQENQNLYDGIIDEDDVYKPFENAANYHIWLATMMIDIPVIKAKKHTLSANPIILLELEEQLKDELIIRDLRDREDRLDFLLRKKVNIEKLIGSGVYREAYIQGTSFVEVSLCNDEEWVKRHLTYKATKDDAVRFTTDFADDLKKGDKEKLDLLSQLYDGKDISFIEDRREQIFFGARAYRRPLKDLYLRPKIHDLRRHRGIFTRLDFVWSDIQKRAELKENNNDTFYIKDAVEELKDKDPENYYKKDYVFFEGKLFCDLDDDGKMRRYIVTMEDITKTVVRAIYYPFEHNKVNIIPYYILPKDDSVYGVGLIERIKDSNKMIDGLWNANANSLAWAHTPAVVKMDSKVILSEKSVYPGAVLPTNVIPFKIEPYSGDIVNTITLAERFAEFSGMTSALMSGRETGLDPSAPASKTAMLLQESNTRIEDSIISLQQSNAELAEQCEKIELQYNADDYLSYFNGTDIIKLKEEIMRIKTRYIPQGVTLSIDKFSDLRLVTQFIQLLVQFFPDKMADPQIRYELLKAVIDTTGGRIEKIKDKINVDPMEVMRQEMIKKIKQILDNTAGVPGAEPLPPMTDEIMGGMGATGGAGMEAGQPPPPIQTE